MLDSTTRSGTGRRGFLCVCCAGLAASGGRGALAAWDATAPSTYRRTIVSTTEYPDAAHVIIQAVVEIDADAVIPQHTHPGIESGFVAAGGGELVVAGQPSRRIGPGDAFEVPAETVHGLRNGGQATKVLVTYVVERDKPLTSLAPG